MKSVQTVIIGGGIAGVASAWWLARRGAEGVLLLERESGLGWHSSGLNAGILRCAIDAPETRELALETSQFLARPPQDFTDTPLIDGRGLVVIEGREGLPDPLWVGPLREAGCLQPMSIERLAKLVPEFRPEGGRAWLMPSAGQIDISGLLSGFARGARSAGVEMRFGARCESLITERSGSVTGVELAGGERIEARQVVLAAGAWAGKLGATVGARFPGRPTRRHLFVTRGDKRIQRDWPIIWDDVAGFYAVPEGPGLMACIGDQDDVAPDACRVDPLVRRVLERRLAHSLPNLDGLPIERAWAAMRTVDRRRSTGRGSRPRCSRIVLGCCARGAWNVDLIGRRSSCRRSAHGSPRRPRLGSGARAEERRPCLRAAPHLRSEPASMKSLRYGKALVHP